MRSQYYFKNDVLLASNVFITDYNHGMSPVANSYLDNPLDISDGVIIGSGAWIGNNVIILGGVSIGEKAVIGAGAVVTKSIPAYSIAVGNPARVIKQYDHKRGEWVSCV
ncbi:acyltransferase [Bifidobacterium pseudocatenulatum]|uniref:acyltransferase n=1 Tax=Bifidobacterium pseudocatenulatum TaxID=28026 RepID=UPI000E43E48F|nr:acyltransferase [Bifidobacterium pseudocatenulatum]